MRRRRLAALAMAAVLLAAAPPRAEAPQRVTVPSRDGTALDAVLLMPKGTGPHPAVILLHGCGGRDGRGGRLEPRHADWAARLAAAGFVVLLPESFASRGEGQQCTLRDRRILSWRERRADALGARDWLAARPFVRAEAIALMGWSHGGSTVLAAADAPGFAAFVAFYPGCSRALRAGGFAPAAPLLLLMGEADDWTPAEPCRLLAERAGPSVTYVGYPGAHHGFDTPDLPLRRRTGLAFSVRGDGTAHVGTDPAARADALARVLSWLAARTGR
jgi:dienelactone hydrolase